MKYEQQNWSADEESLKDLAKLIEFLRNDNKSACIRYALRFTLEALLAAQNKEAS